MRKVMDAGGTDVPAPWAEKYRLRFVMRNGHHAQSEAKGHL